VLARHDADVLPGRFEAGPAELIYLLIDRVDPNHVGDRQQIENTPQRFEERRGDAVLIFTGESRRESDVQNGPKVVVAIDMPD